MAFYRKTEPADVLYLARNLRKADLKELRASTGLPPLEALSKSVALSEEALTIITETGEIAGIFGLARINKTVGCPWLMGTDAIPSISRQFLRVSKDWVEEKNKQYPILTNFVHAHNKVAVQWLRFLGFSFIRLDAEHGSAKEPFYEFVRIKTDV